MSCCIWRFVLNVLAMGLVACSCFGQSSLSVQDVDATRAPVIQASISARDTYGEPLSNLSASDVVVTDNGEVCPVLGMDCNAGAAPVTLSTVISVDISTSMSVFTELGRRRIDVAKAAADEWISRIPGGRWECAIAKFNDRTFIARDYTTNRLKLHESIGGLTPNGGNGADAMLTFPPSGGLLVAATGKYRPRFVLLLTDGEYMWENGTASSIAAVKRSGAVVIALVIGQVATNELRSVASESGGVLYENVASEAEARQIVRKTLKDVGVPDPPSCTISWRTRSVCVLEHSVTISIPRLGISDTCRYSVPAGVLPRLELDPSILDFGPVLPGQSVDTVVTLTAVNGDIEIRDIVSDNTRFLLVPADPFPTTVLHPGEKLQIHLRFLPSDSGYTFARLQVESDDCGQQPILASGGFPGKVSTTRFLHVTAPNGGERLAVGDTFSVTWSGLLPKKSVRLEYSHDLGQTWIPVSNEAAGNSHVWTVPNTPSDSCHMRAAQIATDAPVLLERETEYALGLERRDIIGHTGTGFSANGGLVAQTIWPRSSDGVGGHLEVWIWNAFTGKVMRTAKPASDFVSAIALHPSRNLVALLVGLREIEIRDVDTWTLVSTIPVPYVPGFGSFAPPLRSFDVGWNRLMIAWRSEGYTSTADDSARIIDVNTGALVKSFVQPKHVVGASISPEGTRAVFGLRDGSIEIWDVQTGARINTIPAFIGLYGESNGPVFDRTGTRIVAAGTTLDRRDSIKIWDAASAKLLLAFASEHPPAFLRMSPDGRRIAVGSGHYGGYVTIWNITGAPYIERRLGSNVESAEFSQDGHRICLFEWRDSSQRFDAPDAIWYLDDPPSEIDTSDAPWSIVTPRADAADLDFGDVVVGTSKDSVVTGFIRNSGSVPIHINSLRISGAGSMAFSLLSKGRSTRLAAGDSVPVELRFVPPAVGPYSAIVEIQTSTTPLSATVRGRGVLPSAELGTQFIDFGAIEIGNVKDSVIQVMLKNVGTSPLTVRGVMQSGPDMAQFAILQGGGSLQLAPGEEYPIALRFAPRYIGRTSGSLTVDFDAAGSPGTIQLFGQGVGGDVVVADTSARAGDRIGIPLKLVGPRTYLGKAGVTTFSALLTFRRDVLIPLQPVETVGSYGDYRTVRYQGSWDGGSDIIARIPAVAALGAVDSTYVDLLDFDWIDKAGNPLGVDVGTTGGTFRVTDICTADGQRLLKVGEFGLKAAHPDPARDEVVIEYDAIEHGMARLTLTDAFGRILSERSEEASVPGHYSQRFDVSAYPSGVYLYSLQTPTEKLTRQFRVLH